MQFANMAASYSSERLADRKPIVLIAGLCWNNGGLPPHRQRQRLPGAVISGPVRSGFRRQRSLFKAVPFAFFALAALLCGMASADEAALEWNEVPRIVAIGDLHGDYEQYLKVLTDAGLISKRGKWTGGDTHLVQTGDVTDRGPDSIAIIEHLEAIVQHPPEDHVGGTVLREFFQRLIPHEFTAVVTGLSDAHQRVQPDDEGCIRKTARLLDEGG